MINIIIVLFILLLIISSIREACTGQYCSFYHHHVQHQLNWHCLSRLSYICPFDITVSSLDKHCLKGLVFFMFTDYSCFFSATCFWQHTLTFAIDCGDDKLILWLLSTIINMTGRTRVKNWNNRLPYSRKSEIKDRTLDTIPWNKTGSSTSEWLNFFKDS